MRRVRPDRHRLRTRDGTEIIYYTAGSGLPVLLVNGLGAGWHIWRNQIEYLSDRYRFITWNYRGLSRTRNSADPSFYQMGIHADDALEILEAEAVDKAAAIGWSMGAHVSLEILDRAPHRIASLILIGGLASEPLSSISKLGVIDFFLSPMVRAANMVPRISGALSRLATTSPEVFAWARGVGLVGRNLDEDHFQDLVSFFSNLNVKVLQRTFGYLAEHDAANLLNRVDVPMLVIAGDRDPFSSLDAVQRMVKMVNGAELMVVPGATHYLAADYPEHVNLRIEKFFHERGYSVPPGGEA